MCLLLLTSKHFLAQNNKFSLIFLSYLFIFLWFTASIPFLSFYLCIRLKVFRQLTIPTFNIYFFHFRCNFVNGISLDRCSFVSLIAPKSRFQFWRDNKKNKECNFAVFSVNFYWVRSKLKWCFIFIQWISIWGGIFWRMQEMHPIHL